MRILRTASLLLLLCAFPVQAGDEPETIGGRDRVWWSTQAVARERGPSADEIAAERIKQNLKQPGASGVFQITRKGVRTARVVQERPEATVFALRLPAVTDEQRAAVEALGEVLAGKRLANYLSVLTREAQTIARACGKSHVHNLEPEDLVAVTIEAAAMAQVPLAGTSWIPGKGGI